MAPRAIGAWCLMLALSGAGRAAAEGPIAWGAIVGAEPDKLSSEERAQAVRNLQRIRNTRGCSGTLAECLAKNDLVARRHAGFVLRMVQKGKSDAYIEGGVRARGESAFPQRRFELKLADHPYRGDPRAKVVVVEFACFECPYCAHLAGQLDAFEKRFGNRWAFYFKFFPVRTHPRAVPAALAALAAHRQGRFWPIYRLLFANRADLGDSDLERYAKSLGLDMARYRRDLADPRSLAFIEDDKLDGMAAGVDGTPAFFVNGKLYKSLYDAPEIIDRIDEELDIVEKRIR